MKKFCEIEERCEIKTNYRRQFKIGGKFKIAENFRKNKNVQIFVKMKEKQRRRRHVCIWCLAKSILQTKRISSTQRRAGHLFAAFESVVEGHMFLLTLLLKARLSFRFVTFNVIVMTYLEVSQVSS